MALSNTSRSYGSVSKSFHWLIALLILTVIPLGIVANGLAHDIRDPAIASTDADIARAALLFSIHKTIGVTIFFVALARILWALSQPKPGLLNAGKRIEALAAETVHWLLYGSLLLVPLSGWIHHAAAEGFAPIWWPFGQTLPFVPKSTTLADTAAALHIIFERVLILSIFLHVAGALKHHVIDRDATLRRMWPGRVEAPEPPIQHGGALAPMVLALAVWGAALGIGAGLGLFAGHHSAAAPVPLDEVQSDWTVQDGTLAIAITQMGSTVEGRFADWTAQITFAEPDAPGPAGDVTVTVAIASLTLGSVSDQAMGPDFFDAETWPTARFTAEILRTETGYEARGPLAIRDRTVPVVLPFTLQIDGDTARMQGALTLDRMAFGVGESVSDSGTLGLDVQVNVSLTARRAPQ